MLSLVQKLIRDVSDQQQPTSQPKHHRQLACAALLIEVAYADNDCSDTEQRALHDMLASKFELSTAELDELIRSAQQSQQSATSLYEFTQQINNHYNSEEKFQLVESMWSMAFADGVIDKYEEHLIRRVAELIYISHSDFIRAKLSAKPER
ncbi:tellurite resistance TerB family protein [Aurantivibrio plasticivorans]